MNRTLLRCHFPLKPPHYVYTLGREALRGRVELWVFTGYLEPCSKHTSLSFHCPNSLSPLPPPPKKKPFQHLGSGIPGPGIWYKTHFSRDVLNVTGNKERLIKDIINNIFAITEGGTKREYFWLISFIPYVLTKCPTIHM